MEITLTRPRCNSYNMTAVASTHTCVQLNRITPEDQTGTSPMELLLEAVAGCASIDVILILEEKGRASLTGYKVIASGRRVPPPATLRPFEAIDLHFVIDTDASASKVIRAIELSLEKYCSVAAMLKGNVEITYSLTLNGEKIK
ncbi:MAG: OsmC family protein [Flavobacteriales bacterium]|nr:OsmC family protein [Flavobacteriales bacterium]